jgi:DeoR/GlpR family transcriptional regulator of sugar metabolism
MSILAAERQQQILERLGRDGRVVATALAEAFATSEDTIRRDLRDLAGRGLCRRVYGGALPVSPASRSAQIRAGEATDRKAALGRALAGLIAPDSLLFVDSGSTNLAAVKAFPDDLRLTAATHDPAVAAALLAKPQITFWLIGGRVSREIGAAVGGRLWPTSRHCVLSSHSSASARSIPSRESPPLIRRTPRSNGRFCATPAASPPRY